MALRYRATVMARDPDAYWWMDDPEGTPPQDSSGNDRHATTTNQLIWQQPSQLACRRIGSSIGFSEHSRADVPFGSWMNASEFTVAAVVNIDAGTASVKTVLTRVNSWSFRFTFHNPDVLINLGGSLRRLTAPGPLETDNPHKVATTYDGRIGRLIIDGELVTETDFGSTAAPASVSSPMVIGSWHNAEYMEGQIDELAYWGTALSLADVQAIHASDAPCGQPRPLRHYPRDDNLAGHARKYPSTSFQRSRRRAGGYR